MGCRLKRMLVVALGLGVAEAAAQNQFDNGYVKFQALPGWTVTQSSDQHLVRLQAPRQSAVSFLIVIDKDLPKDFTTLGSVLESRALALLPSLFKVDIGLLVDQPCACARRTTFARWNAVTCETEIKDRSNYRALVSTVGIPLGGSGYLIIAFCPADKDDIDFVREAGTFLEKTIHFWTENVDPNYQAPGSGDYSEPIGAISGTWKGTETLKVQDTLLTTHIEYASVQITFSPDRTYSYQAEVRLAGWRSAHNGHYILTPIPDVPNRYEYNFILSLVPDRGDDRQEHRYKLRFGSMSNGLEFKPDSGVTLHGARNQEEFVLRRAGN